MALESAGGSIIAMLAELMVEPVGRQFRYMFCFNNFVEEFNERKQNLVSAKERLQKGVEAAERNAEETYKDVKSWLEDANNEIEGAKPLEDEIGKNGKCFTWCPNCMRQFKLSKALAKKSKTFRKLGETSEKFKTVAQKAPPQPIEFLTSKEFTPSELSKEALEQIMKALKDDNVNTIGLYGMGGVGKTTLVKEVGRRATESQLFPEVLMATVSQNPNVIGIQDRMADSLHLKFEKTGKEGRASELWQRLQGKKMLIILDDVWKHIDLKEIGIPFGDDHRGCKILLTTRVQGICFSMECQQKVFLRVLPEDEAWDLFRINAGLRDGDSTLNTVAREVARECQGLPIALVTVGRALRGKSRVQWEVASKQLKESQFVRMEQIDEQNNAYTCLKLSYDYLKYEETKSCFVLCCLFPEDYDIPIEDLTRYAVGYGLHQDAEPIEDARKRVSVAIENLKDCCMLLGTETEEHVRMHDLVRDFAIQIASSEEYGFMVKAGIGLKKWPMSNTSFEGCKTISLMGNKLAELPERLGCPQLKVLLLEVDDGMNVPERFFEGMKEIEVLSLKGGCLSLQSLELSTKLQSLVLMECGCKDLIWLRKMQRLKILGFIHCLSIEELPDEIGELKELRLLDVRGCQRLRRIPVNLIGRLKKLEELLIGDDSFEGWDVVGCDSTGGMNASLTELNSLSQLAVLSLRIPKVECIPRDFVFPSLLKYHIILGNGFVAGGYPTSTRLILAGTSFNAKTFEQLFLHKLEFVKVRDCEDVFTLFPAKLRQGLKNLKEVIVHSCKSLEEVFELGEADEGSSEEKEMLLLSSLTTLQLQGLPELKCIWKGPTRNVSLENLVHLKVSDLKKLTFIFTLFLARNLSKLKTLSINNCDELKHIIREEDDEREIIPESPCFPQLKNINISFCDKLECFSLSHNRDGIIKFPQPRRLSLELRSNYSFLGPRNFDAQLPLQKLTIEGHEEVGNWLAQLQQNGFLQRLEFVRVDDCGDVRTPFPAKLLRALNNLKEVIVDSCKSLEEVFELGEPYEGSSEEKELPLPSSLTRLQLYQLPELKCIWKGPTSHVSLQSLADLHLDSLDKLTFIFTPSLVQSLPKLESLRISECGELKHVIREEDGEREIIPESPCFPKLETLYIEECGKLEYVLPVSVSPSLLNLEEMRIFKAHNLKQIFYSVEGDALTRDGIIKFPKLTELSIPNCSFFAPKNFAAQLPSLQYLTIDGHKELGNLSAQLQGFTNLERLFLQHLPDTRCVWKGLVLSKLTTLEMAAHGQQNGSLQRLEYVRVNNCGDVRAPFPAKLLRALNNLRLQVSISTCKSLEEVFELGEADEGSSEEKELLSSLTLLDLRWLPELKCIWKGPTRHVSLQSLNILSLDSLDKLPFIFTPSLAQSLPKLGGLYIKNCAELQHIIREEAGEREIIRESPGQDDQASPINVEKEMVLPNLRELSIQQLSSIVCFSFGWCDYFLFPRLEKLKVHQCPKLTTKFATTPDGSMSAQSEVSEVAEDSSINREWTRDNGWKEEEEVEEEGDGDGDGDD
ncbi:probable disease resistance protein At4g27220 isoform X2 [Populus nigra]|uniref:probable disease resistance protein At4g27220 isoform X2 n=1 Tax=Populus nigra TaxID=3691 RepID=UPI002B277E39|nr:probable disease resistance protein At4g27220 isoform X2 [Populus nigra]